MIQPTDKTVQLTNEQLASIFAYQTVKKVDTDSVNCTTFEFTNGDSVLLEVEAFGGGLYGNVGYVLPETFEKYGFKSDNDEVLDE